MVTVTATPYGQGLYGAGRYGGQLVRTGATGHGGAVAFRAHYYRCTRQGQITEDLTPLMRGGELTWNADQDTHHGEVRVTCTPGGVLTPMAEDYLKITCDLAYADGTTITGEPLGQYRVVEVNPTINGHAVLDPTSLTPADEVVDDILAYDLVYELSTSRVTIPYPIPQGANPIDIIISNLEWIGFTADQWAGPATARGTRATYPYDPGTARQTFINDLLAGMGNYHVWMGRDGRFRSAPSLTLERSTPVASYVAGGGQPSNILPGAQGTPDYSRLCNVVTVRNISPGQPAIWWTAKNEDPSSPLALVHNGVGVLALPPEDNPQITTTEEAKARAEQLLSEGSSYNDRWAFATHPDPFFDLHNVVSVSITGSDGSDLLSGNFWRRSFTMPLDLAGWQQGQRMSLSRITPFEVSGSGAP